MNLNENTQNFTILNTNGTTLQSATGTATTAGGFYLIQPQQQNIQTNQLVLKPANQTQIQFITQQPQHQPQQQIITTTNNSIKYIQQTTAQPSSPRIQTQPTTLILQPSQGQQTSAGTNGQIFFSINNRLVPVQSVNLKPQTPQAQTTTVATSTNPQYVILPSANQQQQQQQTNNTNQLNLGAEIADKMKLLEQIQNQLKLYQQKILTASNSNTNEQSTTSTPTVLTQAQIQAVLNPNEQAVLQKLLIQKKTVESEIQQLKQKLLAPNTPLTTTTTTTILNPSQTPSNTNLNTKLQLLQQVTLKLNALRSSKTVTTDTTNGQQQLVLTHEEFDQMKKLIDLQNQLQNEIKQMGQTSSSQTTTSTVQTQPQPQITTTIKLNELSLPEKYKLNDIIKSQIEQIKQTLTSSTSTNNAQQMQQIKDKYVMLVKKQAEIQSLIDKQEKESKQIIIPNANNSLPKQTPIKIRNVLSSTQSPTTTTILKPQTPLRTLVINNKDNTSSTLISSTPLVTAAPPVATPLVPLSVAVNLHKQNFAHVQFKCLNFEELAQNSVITKDTDELTILLLKQLDDRASQVINREQLESFTKNQVKLVKKYLEQQIMAKTTIRNRISEQLAKDQKLASEPDYKTPFTDKTDAIKRLSRYHVFQKTYFEPSEQESKKFDECFEEVSERLIKIADAMKKRFNLLQLRSMQKDVVSSEETMLLKLYVDDLKQNIEQEKQVQKEKEKQQLLIQQKPPQIEKIKTSDNSPQTIRKLIQITQANQAANNNLSPNNQQNDFILNTSSLKRSHADSLESSNLAQNSSKQIKLEPIPVSSSSSSILAPVQASESSSSLYNQQQSTTCSSAYASSSSSSSLLKIEAQNTDSLIADQLDMDNLDETLTEYENHLNDDTKTSNHVDLVNSSSNNQTNSFINDQFDLYNQSNSLNSAVPVMATSLLNDNEENTSPGINNLSGLDEFILNEDDLAVQGILDF